MHHLLKKLLPSVAVALTVTSFSLPAPARAQTYPIDCAILLCLSGGWPASVPCARARAEFIRRITPWPVEPPLQIWRCPMGASYESDRQSNNAGRIFEALYRTDSRRPLQSLPVDNLVPTDFSPAARSGPRGHRYQRARVQFRAVHPRLRCTVCTTARVRARWGLQPKRDRGPRHLWDPRRFLMAAIFHNCPARGPCGT